MKTRVSAILFLFLCFCTKKENPNPLVEKEVPNKRDSTERAVFVSGFSLWRVVTTNSTGIVQNYTPEKDSTFVEIFVNGDFRTCYLAIPSQSGPLKFMMYHEGRFLEHLLYFWCPCPPNPERPVMIFSAKAGDSILVRTIYKPFKLFKSDDAAKMLGAGMICTSLPLHSTGPKAAILYPPANARYSTADTVGTGKFEFKRWRVTSTASETCVAISLAGKVL